VRRSLDDHALVYVPRVLSFELSDELDNAVCCRVLQCVAVCCSVLQCVAAWYSIVQSQRPCVCIQIYGVMQCVAVCCSTLQWVTVCCNVLQCVAVWCSAKGLMPAFNSMWFLPERNATSSVCTRCLLERCTTLQHNATHCNTLQHTATHCNTLQHTAIHCNILQHNTLNSTS